ncbi:hypothetical protein TSAR_003911 [Trichomalopsis sarcophagae]|uniref:Uncharacterized protein n=1 Tax=Trichomalopsis sarcophagae TaxID=543379 RepID=A0A232EK31_9HYME|nr:hypothetical protein TSAR_003911 [Trichomalopsis sarcophagae]
MVVKIAIIVFFTCLAVALSKPADNPMDSFASNIPGLNAAQSGLGSVSKGISDNYKGAQGNVVEPVNFFQRIAENGIEDGMNIAERGVRLFTSPLGNLRNIAANFGI